MKEQISVTMHNNLSEVETLQERVSEIAERLEYPPKAIFQISLVLEEVLTNVIKYAFENPAISDFNIDITMSEDEFAAEVADAGRPFNPLAAPPPDLDLPIEKKPIGGLGIHLVRSIMTHLDYRYEGGKNHFILKKLISRA